MAVRAGVGALGTDHAGPCRCRLAGSPAARGRHGRGGPHGRQRRPIVCGGGERGDSRGGAGRSPAPPPGGLAAAGTGAVGGDGHDGLRVRPLWGGGSSGVAPGRQLSGWVLRRHPRHLAVLRRLRPAAHADRVAALAALAVVGPSRGGCAGGGPAVGVARPSASGAGASAGHQPAVCPGPGRAAVGRRCGQRVDRPGGAGGRGLVAGGAFSPRPGGGPPAAAVAGVRGGAGVGCVAGGRGRWGDVKGSYSPGRHRVLRGAAAAGDRRGGPALPAVRPGPHHQPHGRLRPAHRAARRRLRRRGPRPWPAPRPSTGASTGVATTPPARSRRSAPGCASRSTSTPSRPSCSAWSSRRCSQPACRCGCDLPSARPPSSAAQAHPVRRHRRRQLPRRFARLCDTGWYQREASSVGSTPPRSLVRYATRWLHPRSCRTQVLPSGSRKSANEP